MKKTGKLLAFVLAMVLLLSACAESTTGTTAGTIATTGASTVASTTATTKKTRQTTAPVKFPANHINEDTNFHGETFTFAILTDSGISGYGICESEDGIESVNKAIKERDEYFYDIYNAKIETVKTSAEALLSELEAGKCTADFVYAKQGAVSTEYCRNISTMEIEFKDKPWWGVTWPMAVDGKGYALSGSFSLEIFNSAQVIFFNKGVKEQIPSLKDVDFYKLTEGYKSKEWTLDKLLEFSRAAYEAGKTGFVSELNGISALYFGAGQTFLSQTEHKSGVTIFEHGFNESAKEITNKIIAIFGDNSVKTGTKANVYDTFKSGETLFAKGTVGDIEKYFNEKVNFGILPLPFRGVSEGGITSVGADTPFLFVLNSGASPEYTECFLWYYVYYSYYIVDNEFYKCNAYLYSTDTESAESFSMIWDSLTFDHAYYNNWLDVNEKYTSAVLAGENPIEGFSTGLGEELEAKAREKYGQTLEQ